MEPFPQPTQEEIDKSIRQSALYSAEKFSTSADDLISNAKKIEAYLKGTK